jgi:putative ABC transport system ATP-binding protein
MSRNNPHKAAVVCRGITKEFGIDATRVRALRGVNLRIYPGELTVLVGPSGSGKTTLLSVLAGILNPTAGRLWVLGTNLSAIPDRRKVRFRGPNIGFVFQQFNLLPTLTAAENVVVPLAIAGCWKRRALEQARQLLDRLGMAERSEAMPAELSGGEQQRVAIARSLIHDPRLVVCDEPTSALDQRTGHTVMERFRSIAVQRDRAVLVVTHDPRVFKFADRIAQMEDGCIVSVRPVH